MNAGIGRIVRVMGKSGDWRVKERSLSIGTHVPMVYLEAVQETWQKNLIVPVAQTYPSLLIPLAGS